MILNTDGNNISNNSTLIVLYGKQCIYLCECVLCICVYVCVCIWFIHICECVFYTYTYNIFILNILNYNIVPVPVST